MQIEAPSGVAFREEDVDEDTVPAGEVDEAGEWWEGGVQWGAVHVFPELYEEGGDA